MIQLGEVLVRGTGLWKKGGRGNEHSPGNGADQTNPQTHDTGNGSAIVTIAKRWTQLFQGDLSGIFCVGGDPCTASGDDDGKGNGIGKGHDGDDEGADPPGPANVFWLIAFGEEEIEEESGAEDGGDGDADKDVV